MPVGQLSLAFSGGIKYALSVLALAVGRRDKDSRKWPKADTKNLVYT